jgi:hypothetical protein
VNGKNKIFILMHVKKIDFISKIEKKYFYRDLTHKNNTKYSNNQGMSQLENRTIHFVVRALFPSYCRAIQITSAACSCLSRKLLFPIKKENTNSHPLYQYFSIICTLLKQSRKRL